MLNFFLFVDQDAKDLMKESTKREDLEDHCMEQAAKIEELNQLVMFSLLELDELVVLH